MERHTWRPSVGGPYPVHSVPLPSVVLLVVSFRRGFPEVLGTQLYPSYPLPPDDPCPTPGGRGDESGRECRTFGKGVLRCVRRRRRSEEWQSVCSSGSGAQRGTQTRDLWVSTTKGRVLEGWGDSLGGSTQGSSVQGRVGDTVGLHVRPWSCVGHPGTRRRVTTKPPFGISLLRTTLVHG